VYRVTCTEKRVISPIAIPYPRANIARRSSFDLPRSAGQFIVPARVRAVWCELPLLHECVWPRVAACVPWGAASISVLAFLSQVNAKSSLDSPRTGTARRDTREIAYFGYGTI
jgi:hypothetical protein